MLKLISKTLAFIINFVIALLFRFKGKSMENPDTIVAQYEYVISQLVYKDLVLQSMISTILSERAANSSEFLQLLKYYSDRANQDIAIRIQLEKCLQIETTNSDNS